MLYSRSIIAQQRDGECMQGILNIAITAARKAGDVILRGFDRVNDLTIIEKNKNDFVTAIDKDSEREIIHIIRKNFPSHGILAEESGETSGDETVWIIDPLDGTTNFIHGFPHFAVSIGIQYRDKIEHGVIYDPIRQELFVTSRGAGARLNDRRVRVSQNNRFDHALLSTGLPPSHREALLDPYMKSFYRFAKQCGDIRRGGSAALDLAYVAAGRIEGYWEFSLSPWDLAAGMLMVREAGGFATNFAGEDTCYGSGNILAATTKIYPLMFKQLTDLQCSKTK